MGGEGYDWCVGYQRSSFVFSLDVAAFFYLALLEIVLLFGLVAVFIGVVIVTLRAVGLYHAVMGAATLSSVLDALLWWVLVWLLWWFGLMIGLGTRGVLLYLSLA
jgi:hypothetical protein